MVDRRFWADALRNAKGLAETGRMIVQPMVGDIPAGLTGLGSMMLGEDQGTSAARVRQVQDQFAYTPSEDARPYVDALGKSIDWAGRKLKQLPGAERAQQGWEDFTVAAPGAAAITAAVFGAGVPESRGARGAGRAIDAAEEARLAALRQVRETTPAGPVFVSAVEEAVPSLPRSATVGQYVATLRNKPGIKGEEIADLGLETWDPAERLTSEQFLQRIQAARPSRETRRLSYENLPSSEIDAKADEMVELRARSLAGNPAAWDQSGIADLFPIDTHPGTRTVLENKRRKEAWDAFIAEDPDIWPSALELAVEETADEGTGRAIRLVEDFFDGDEDAVKEMHSLANMFMNRARDDVDTWIMLKGIDQVTPSARPELEAAKAEWLELNKQYGTQRGFGETDQAMFTRQIQENPEAMARLRESVIAELRANPQRFSWEGYRDEIPQYPSMRYYGDVEGVNPGYVELLEQQGAMPTSRDPRPYREPHWSDISGGRRAPNDVTMHLRMDEVQTPEGQPAMLLNELQSKYAATAGEQGLTSEPVTVAGMNQMLDNEMNRVETLVNDPDADLDNSFAAHEYDQETFTKIANLRENFDDMTGDEADAALADIRESIRKGYAHTSGQFNEEPPTDTENLSMLMYRGEPFGRDNARLYADPLEAAKRAELFNSGGGNAFQGDPRLPPRAGLKSWRLRGLKMALREAADRGATDLYFPTGQMMPRIENWVPDEGGFDPTDLRSRDVVDKDLVRMAEGFQDDNLNDASFSAVMRNYEERLPKEWEKYLKKYGATIERSPMLPKGGNAEHAATAQRIRFTPELLAEVLRGQKLYQLAGGAGLLGLLLANQQEQPQL